MAFCVKCGNQIGDGVQFCPNCGAPAPVSGQPNNQQAPPPGQSAGGPGKFEETFKNINNTADTTGEYTREDIEQNKVMAILAYIGILVLVPIFAAPQSKFARFHANQGLVLAICEVAFGIVYGIITSLIFAISWRLGFLSTIIGLLWIVFLVMAVIGIINASNGKAKELPFIGKFKILK